VATSERCGLWEHSPRERQAADTSIWLVAAETGFHGRHSESHLNMADQLEVSLRTPTINGMQCHQSWNLFLILSWA
jgi:hypothetical protein